MSKEKKEILKALSDSRLALHDIYELIIEKENLSDHDFTVTIVGILAIRDQLWRTLRLLKEENEG